MNALSPTTVATPRQSLSRKTLLAWLANQKARTLPQLLEHFHGLEPASAFRLATKNRFARNAQEVYSFRQTAIHLYQVQNPVPHLFKAISLIARLNEEGLVYITNDRQTLMPPAPKTTTP